MFLGHWCQAGELSMNVVKDVVGTPCSHTAAQGLSPTPAAAALPQGVKEPLEEAWGGK